MDLLCRFGVDNNLAVSAAVALLTTNCRNSCSLGSTPSSDGGRKRNYQQMHCTIDSSQIKVFQRWAHRAGIWQLAFFELCKTGRFNNKCIRYERLWPQPGSLITTVVRGQLDQNEMGLFEVSVKNTGCNKNVYVLTSRSTVDETRRVSSDAEKRTVNSPIQVSVVNEFWTTVRWVHILGVKLEQYKSFQCKW